jgi:hypothetical protein
LVAKLASASQPTLVADAPPQMFWLPRWLSIHDGSEHRIRSPIPWPLHLALHCRLGTSDGALCGAGLVEVVEDEWRLSAKTDVDDDC